jgi:hypothetical protein
MKAQSFYHGKDKIRLQPIHLNAFQVRMIIRDKPYNIAVHYDVTGRELSARAYDWSGMVARAVQKNESGIPKQWECGGFRDDSMYRVLASAVKASGAA